MDKISSGCKVFDELLEGGYENDVVTTIYGPAGSGKTTACLLAAINAAKEKKVIFMDAEGGFSAVRLQQICKDDTEKVLQNLLFLKPTNFEEQKKDIEKIKKLANEKIGLIICDTISMLYRVERGEDNQGLNRELGKQLSALVELSRKKNIPIIVTSQVYSDFENRNAVHMVGGDILKYSSKCLIELQSSGSNKRAVILKKHRHLPEKQAFFEIREEGFLPAKEKFKLF